VKREDIVIVGNSGAAINAIKGIRRVNYGCSITLFSQERYNAYSPVLTTYLVAGKVPRDKMTLADEDFYDHYRVERRYSQRILSVHARDRLVSSENGTTVGYDKLLIATGSSPKRLDCEMPAGLPVFSLRTVEDAEKIRAGAPTWRKVVFSGAGLVSLQIANALRKCVERMVFIVGSDQILSQNLDAQASSLIQKRIEAGGGTVLFNRKIVGLERSGAGVMVRTDGGDAVAGDALLVGKGVDPNIPEIVPGGTVHVHRGILVDSRMRTSEESIFAAGDVCEGTELLSGETRLISNWPNACRQGLVAGQNMGGGEAHFEGSLAMNVTSLFGLSFASIGEVRDNPVDGTEVASYLDGSQGIYKKWVLRDDRLIGALMVGDVGENACAAEIIRSRVSISEVKKALTARPWEAAGILSGLL
jgi:NAD(P)H-nitrite reductase large subunit